MKTNKIFVVFVAIAFAIAGGAYAEAAEPLQARIEHSESLPAVEPELRAGAKFDESLINRIPSKSRWFKIPSWIAGVWQRTMTTDKVLGFLPVTHQDIRLRRYGFQTDNYGEIWHWVRTPFPVITDTGNRSNYFLIRVEEPISVSEDQVTVHMIWTSWSIRKDIGIIDQVVQGDQIDSFRKLEPNVIQANSSLANYTELGKLRLKYKATWKDYLVEPYQRINEYKGVNVRELFVDFLARRGEYLVN